MDVRLSDWLEREGYQTHVRDWNASPFKTWPVAGHSVASTRRSRTHRIVMRGKWRCHDARRLGRVSRPLSELRLPHTECWVGFYGALIDGLNRRRPHSSTYCMVCGSRRPVSNVVCFRVIAAREHAQRVRVVVQATPLHAQAHLYMRKHTSTCASTPLHAQAHLYMRKHTSTWPPMQRQENNKVLAVQPQVAQGLPAERLEGLCVCFSGSTFFRQHPFRRSFSRSSHAMLLPALLPRF
jgi:hypothetical protein